MPITLFGHTVDGLIFDMDGTLVDNMMTHHRAWQLKLAELGLELTLEEVRQRIHGVNEEILERLFGDRFTTTERQQHAQEKEAAYRRVARGNIQLLPGLDAFLNHALQQDVPMAVGTAAPPENADFVVEELGLDKYFKAVRHSGHVSRGKPDPEVFQLAAAGIGLPVERCLIFEDSPTGAEAAHRAGSPAVVITTTHRAEEFAHLPNVLACLPDYTNLLNSLD